MTTAKPGLKTTLEQVLEWERIKPHACFLRQARPDGWFEMSYTEAMTQARKMTTFLQSLGLQKGDHISIVSKNCYHWILADLAIMMGGFVSVPFFPNLTQSEYDHLYTNADVKLVFTGKLEKKDSESAANQLKIPQVSFPHYDGNVQLNATYEWDQIIASYEEVKQYPTSHPDDLWTIIYTSGTTGFPKGVMLNYGSPAKILEMEKEHDVIGLFRSKEHKFFSYLPLNHIAERIIVEYACMVSGGSISFAESIDTFAKNLQDTQPTIFLAVPRIWVKFQMAILEKFSPKKLNFLLKTPIIGTIIKRKIKEKLGLNNNPICLTGAASISPEVKSWYTDLGIYLKEVYGMTENCGGCVTMRDRDMTVATVGKKLPTTDLKIDSDTGEILMKAPWQMKGYYKNPEKTQEVIRDGWIHTGDQGRLDENGYLYISGRVKDSFKTSKGKYIMPKKCEEKLLENKNIEQICLVGLNCDQPMALVVLSDQAKQKENELIKSSLRDSLVSLNRDLPNYQKLSTIIVMSEPWTPESGLLTPTLKVKRNAINEQFNGFYTQWQNDNESIIFV